MTAVDSKDVLIRMLGTPNPYAWKFILNVPLKNKGRASFYSPKDCLDLPLFKTLFDISGILQIYVFQNQITVTQDGSLTEQEIEKQVTAVVGSRIGLHNPDFLSFEEQQKAPMRAKNLSPEVLKVEKILDRTVRPGLRADGGDLEVLEVTDSEVKISYQGACGGCPSAFMGTLEAIESILRQETGRENLKVTPV